VLNNKHKPVIVVLAISSAILYNIWPLGYLLDPNALHHSYVSVLEVSNKPYAWLFILADILTGLLVMTVGLALWKIKLLSKRGAFWYILFGIATLLEAIIPIASRCAARISACGISLSQILSPHDIASIVEAVALFISLLGIRRMLSKSSNQNLYKWVSPIFWIWCATGIFLITSIVIDNFTTVSQALYLFACGVGLIAVPTSLMNIKQP
jgi:hypothetical protein